MPFAGTALGAATIFLLHSEISARVQKLLTGFAAGVMTAAAVWSLLLPAIEMSRRTAMPAWLPAAAGFLCGVAFLLALDSLIPHLHLNADEAEGPDIGLHRTAKLILAVTLHNIPEGMAVGVVLGGALSGSGAITAAAAMALSFGIAVQNIPEGAIISWPMRGGGNSRVRSFVYGVLSGAVEPTAGLATVVLIDPLSRWLPWLLSFAAGAMIYVVVEELIPETQQGRHSDCGTTGVAAGFVLMMVLDVALG